MNRDEPTGLDVGGNPLLCLVCGGDQFHLKEGFIIVDGATALGLAMRNPKADLAICQECGFTHTFFKEE